MFETFEDVRRHMADVDIRMVDLKFVDLWGGWHHVTLPAGQFTEDVPREGVGFDGSSVGFRGVASGDMVLAGPGRWSWRSRWRAWSTPATWACW